MMGAYNLIMISYVFCFSTFYVQYGTVRYGMYGWYCMLYDPYITYFLQGLLVEPELLYEFAVLGHLLHNVEAPDQVAVHVQLRKRRPV